MALVCNPLPKVHPITAVYTDGGIIGPNPSRIGGAWAFVAIVDAEDGVVYERSGVIKPPDVWGHVAPRQAALSTIENNIAETIAILLALEALPEGWRGTFYGDNLNSIRRAREPRECKDAVPRFLRDRLVIAAETRHVEFHLLGGHPTAVDVQRGCRIDGTPVSKWNARADKLCRMITAQYKWRTK